MINFRYHLVSLIGVFLALAIGVVLGAGPLQTRLGDAWASQGDAGSADVSAQLAQAQADAQAQSAALDELGQRALPGTLDGVSVALVTLPGAATDDADAVSADLRTAGATVAGKVSLTDNWQSQSMSQYRDTLAGPVSTHLASAAPADATSDAVIGYALVEVLTSTGSEQGLLSDILTDPSTPIMSLDEDPKGAAQAVVVVGPRASEADGTSGTPAQSGGTTSAATSAWVGLARAVASAPSGAVVVGDASTPDALVAQIRAQGVVVTTVDSVGTDLGALGTALALPGAAGAGEARAFGVGDDASQVLPPIPGLD
ncbi:MAG: copper transporter [Actinomyces sp.]|jgi:hypothetical protein|nr:copper transporter [Actinomyces sp.]MCI1642309.1 copper transporter [Actinomyces sp.]MCI1662884.1 copper transporter [Actinomyces sp.]MCI1691445.1 copper transporter [Actinomyces sp.]MCI1788872.1 copper transporter [Actinomyces sp.]MCI1830674.1 copper transporter [Actinomyces sp.]